MEHYGLFALAKSISCTAWLDCLFKFQVGQDVGYCSNYFGSSCWLLFPLFWIRLLVTVPIILDQVVGYCSHYFGSGCWLLFTILSQAVDYCSHYFGSGCWLLITLFWTWLLVSVPIILDHAVGYGSNDVGSGCWLLFQ